MLNVQHLCEAVWAAREAGKLTRDEIQLSQQLYVAVAADIADGTTVKYDPERDQRVAWLREIILGVRRGMRLPKACTGLEDVVAWLLYGKVRPPCGRDLAAGPQ